MDEKDKLDGDVVVGPDISLYGLMAATVRGNPEWNPSFASVCYAKYGSLSDVRHASAQRPAPLDSFLVAFRNSRPPPQEAVQERHAVSVIGCAEQRSDGTACSKVAARLKVKARPCY